MIDLYDNGKLKGIDNLRKESNIPMTKTFQLFSIRQFLATTLFSFPQY